MEDFCNRYEIGKLGGEGQGILSDALLSINDWMMKNGHTTQLYFVVRDAATDTSSGKFFRAGKKMDHTIHFTVGEPVLAQVWYPEPGTACYTLQRSLCTHSGGARGLGLALLLFSLPLLILPALLLHTRLLCIATRTHASNTPFLL